MPQDLKGFLSELAVSPEKLTHYLKSPDEAMKEAGLNAEECAALKSKDPARVSAMLAGEPGSGGHRPICLVQVPSDFAVQRHYVQAHGVKPPPPICLVQVPSGVAVEVRTLPDKAPEADR
jgi:hypothetical protein